MGTVKRTHHLNGQNVPTCLGQQVANNRQLKFISPHQGIKAEAHVAVQVHPTAALETNRVSAEIDAVKVQELITLNAKVDVGTRKGGLVRRS